MLQTLNYDCLLEIFELLDLKDQLQLTDVCQYFHFFIIKYIWSRKYREIRPQMKCLQSLSTEQYKKFFQYNSKNIHKLEIEDTNNFAYAGYLYVNRFNVRPDYSFYLSLKMQNLKELHCRDQRIHDGYIRMLNKYCPKLEILHVQGNHVTGAHIREFRHLKVLQIGDNITRFDCNNNTEPYEIEMDEAETAYEL